MSLMKTSKFFKPYEFIRCVPSCKIEQISQNLLDRLDAARELAQIPFVITSAYRPAAYELSKGRNGYSSHCKGLAVDIRCSDSSSRLIILQSLLSAGFVRIGIYSKHIHVDIDSSKPPCIYLGSYEKK